MAQQGSHGGNGSGSGRRAHTPNLQLATGSGGNSGPGAYDDVGAPLFSPHMEADVRMFGGRMRPHSGAALATEARALLTQDGDGSGVTSLGSSGSLRRLRRPTSDVAMARRTASDDMMVGKELPRPPSGSSLGSSSARRRGSLRSLVDPSTTGAPSVPAQPSPLHEMGQDLLRQSLGMAGTSSGPRGHRRVPSRGWEEPAPAERSGAGGRSDGRARSDAERQQAVAARLAQMQGEMASKYNIRVAQPDAAAARGARSADTAQAPTAVHGPGKATGAGQVDTSPIKSSRIPTRRHDARPSDGHGSHSASSASGSASGFGHDWHDTQDSASGGGSGGMNNGRGNAGSADARPRPPPRKQRVAVPQVEKFAAPTAAGGAGADSDGGSTRRSARKSRRGEKLLSGTSRRRAPSPAPAKGGRPSANAGLNDISLVKSVQGAALRAAVVCGKEVWSAHGYQISIRDATTGEVKHEMPTDSHHSIVWCFVVVGRYVWAGTSTGPINIYDVRKRTLVKTARHHAGGVHTLATGVDSERVFSGSNDFTCVMWSGRGEFLKLYAGHSNGVRCTLALGPMLWTGADDHTIRVWDTNKCECKSVLSGHTDSVLGLSAGAGGTSVWSASSDGSLRQWGLQHPHDCLSVVDVGQRVNCLAPVGDTMWSCGSEPIIRVWKTADFSNIRALEGHTGFVGSLLQVRRVESHWLWSYGLGDKVLNIWRQDSRISGSRDASELLAMAQAANRLYEPMIAEVEREKERVSKEGAALAQKVQVAEQRLADLDHREERVSTSEADVARAINEVLEKLAATSEERDEVQAALARKQREATALKSEVTRLSSDNQNIRARAADAEATAQELRDDVKAAQGRASSLKLECDAAKSAGRELEERMSQQVAHLEQQLEQVPELQAVRKRTEARVLELEQELRRVQRQAQEDAEAAQAKIGELVAAAGRQTLQIAELEQRGGSISQDRDKLQAAIAQAQAQVESLQEELRDARADAASARAEADTERRRAEELAGQAAESERAAAAREAEAAAAHTELTTKLEHLRQQHKRDKLSLKMARAQLDQAEADAGQRKDELAIAQGRVAEVEGKLRTTEESLRSMEEEVQEQTYTLEQKDDELSEARTRVSQLESEVASTSAELESIRQRADAATRSGGDMRQYISEKEAQLKELSDAAKQAKATIDAYASREKALEKRFLELDVFKLDSVATAMKKVDEDITRVRKDVSSFDAKQFSNYGDREKVVRLTRHVGEELGLLRSQMRDVLCECLDEMDAQRLGIDIRDASTAKQALGLSVARREFGSVLAGIQAQIRAGNTFGLDPSELG